MLLVCLLCATSVLSRPIVIVVAEQSPVQKLTIEELRQLYLGERRSTSEGHELTLTIRPSGSAEKDAVLTVLNVDEGAFKRTWLSKVYQGEAVAPPLPLTSNESVRRFLVKSPLALGVLAADAERGKLRVVLQLDDGK